MVICGEVTVCHGEPLVVPDTRTSANVDDVSIPAILAAINELTDNELPVDELLALSTSVSMDDEKQQCVAVLFCEVRSIYSRFASVGSAVATVFAIW